MPTIDQVRAAAYAARLYGLKVPVEPVCRGHQSPGMMLAQLVYDRPAISLWQGPRGGGKSLISSLALYILGQKVPGFEAKILGGSQAQSQQIYRGMELLRKVRPEADMIREMLKTEAWFHGTDAHVEMLTASDKSVRGPHVPQLCLDEVDEIEDAVREAAFGMAMRKGDIPASVSMTSTWHRVAGPMAELMARGRDGEFPVGTFCMFDVLERCPDERSGPALENCPDCPLVRWCHADRDDREHNPLGLPRAKRSCGHYDIDALVQKVRGVSDRIFASDYLCLEPRPQGQWFTQYDQQVHEQEAAEYVPGVPYHVSIDPGVHTGAVLFQMGHDYRTGHVRVNVFGDYFAEGESAERNAVAIAELAERLTGMPIRTARVSIDPAGRQRNAVGPAVVAEYHRAQCVGRAGIEDWPLVGPARPKVDSLQLVEALLLSADGTVSLTHHPRCRHLRDAFKGYVRERSPDGQWLDDPKSVQHPAEEHIDALAGGLGLELPGGRKNPALFRTVHAARLH